MPGLIARTSTIFISSGNGTRVYRSIAEVPPRLRRKLQRSTTGMNSATILIADRRGREELVRALRGEPSETWSLLVSARARETGARTSVPAATDRPGIDQYPKSHRRRLPSVRTWLELFLPVLVGASLWLLIDSHF